jgi:hypothetical protein
MQSDEDLTEEEQKELLSFIEGRLKGLSESTTPLGEAVFVVEGVIYKGDEAGGFFDEGIVVGWLPDIETWVVEDDKGKLILIKDDDGVPLTEEEKKEDAAFLAAWEAMGGQVEESDWLKDAFDAPTFGEV